MIHYSYLNRNNVEATVDKTQRFFYIINVKQRSQSMYLFRRISFERNITKGAKGRVDLYQSLNPNLNYLIGCAKSNVKALDDKLPNWHVIEKNPDQKYHPGCVFQAECMTVM